MTVAVICETQIAVTNRKGMYGYVVFFMYKCYSRLKRASFPAKHVAMFLTSINLISKISCDDGLS